MDTAPCVHRFTLIPGEHVGAAGGAHGGAPGRSEPGQPTLAERREFLRAAGDPDVPLADAVHLARADLWTREAPARAVARLDAALAAHPVMSLPTQEARRAALEAAALYAAAGAPARAQAVLTGVEAAADSAERRRLASERARARAELALAAGRGAEALRLFRASEVAGDGTPASRCTTCVLPALARAAERAGWADSTRVFWTRFAEEPALDRFIADQWHLARAYRRLGELWMAAGDDAKAMRYAERFVALRAAAEPALQTDVAAGAAGGGRPRALSPVPSPDGRPAHQAVRPPGTSLPLSIHSAARGCSGVPPSCIAVPITITAPGE